MKLSLKPLINFISSLRQFLLEDIWRLDFSKLSPFKALFIKQVQIIIHVVRRFQQDRLMVRAAALYASFAVFPLFLVWLFFSWTVVLLGSEISYVHQNLDKISWEEQAKSISWRMEESIALRIMLVVSQKFCRDERAPSLSDLSEYLRVPQHAVENVLSVLLDLELVNVIGRGEERYAPAKCLEGLSLQEIMKKLRTYGVTDQREGRDDAITRLVDEIQSQYDIALKQAFDEASLRDLLNKMDEEHI